MSFEEIASFIRSRRRNKTALVRIRFLIDSLIGSQEVGELPVIQKKGREVVKVVREGKITRQLERVRCGKPSCWCARGGGHGPYWYAYLRKNGKLVSKYLGKNI